MVPEKTKTTKALYSRNEGRTWQEIVVSTEPIYFISVISESSNMEIRFILYGQSNEIISIDFGD